MSVREAGRTLVVEVRQCPLLEFGGAEARRVEPAVAELNEASRGLLLGLIAAITEAIPILGPLLGAIPAILIAATVSPELALVVAGVYIVLQAVEGVVLVPIVMRNTIGISPLLVLLSLLIVGAAGGVMGALLAVPVAASLEIVLSRLQARAVPVAQDPASIEAPDEGALVEYGRSLPDAANARIE